ncbi:unnamed protein product [Paramecium sonneborni]|uniref:Uncharacterized protein n=1 Tax=Paramecium sonneborni TaxID=65129 RepID=A0A8S1N4B0_9CILI|nr:unnamed protein product [Paramecium sonneborni]
MKRDGCNERNYNKLLSNFYQRDNPYSNLIYSIYEQTSGKKYYWQCGFKYEFIFMHNVDIEVPQISKKTQLEDAFQQLRTLKIQRHKELQELRLINLERFSF